MNHASLQSTTQDHIKAICCTFENILSLFEQIRRAVAMSRKALMSSFVPSNLGFAHISRDTVVEDHTRHLAKDLFSTVTESPAILVLDGTYIYIQKSANFTFQRRSYSLHKHRALVKPMIVVTTSGYIVTVLGPYLADVKNSDTNILNHMVKTNAEEIKEWVEVFQVNVISGIKSLSPKSIFNTLPFEA